MTYTDVRALESVETFDSKVCCALQLPLFDNSKAREELGLDFTDIKQTAQDMAASLLELGVLKRLPGAPVSGFYSKL